MLQRMDALEAEIRRLAALTEDLQIRVDSVVRDGTNRVGDLEFRLCELEADCDIGEPGGDAEPRRGGAVRRRPGDFGHARRPGSGPQLAVAEQDDFDRARAAFEAGDYAAASAALLAFTQTYPGGPLSAQAHFLRGEAEARQNAWSAAARAYLDSFSAAPDGEIAPAALTALGRALGRLGQTEEACLTLQEVAVRYPGRPGRRRGGGGTLQPRLFVNEDTLNDRFAARMGALLGPDFPPISRWPCRAAAIPWRCWRCPMNGRGTWACGCGS
jgi:tol-pal system protein YbgF